jgi:haloacid dehalogenase-like hydrolase
MAFWYRVRRRALAISGAFSGAAVSLPPVGARLARRLLREASTKRILVADLDGTLSPHNGLIPREIAAAMAAAIHQGKAIVLVTSRAAAERNPPGALLAPESLQNVPACALPGLVIASSRDGYILQYDHRGQLQMLHREPAFSDSEKRLLVEAIESGFSSTPELSELRNSLERLDFSSLTLSAIFTPGCSPKDVLTATQSINEQLGVRGLPFRGSARLVINETLGHYIEIPKIDKQFLVRKVARLVGELRAEDSLIVGDSMATPEPEPERARTRFLQRVGVVVGQLLGGQRIVVGSDADRDMERALPGALSVSVGGAADPAMPRGYFLAGGWEKWTPRLIAAWAAAPLHRSVSVVPD